MTATNDDSARAANDPDSRRRWWPLGAKFLIVVLVVWGVQRTIRQAIHQFDAESLQIAPGWLAVAAVCYLVGLLPAAWYWFRLLRAFGQPVSWKQSVRAYYIGHLGKYVPGKAMVIVLRVGLIKGVGVSVTGATVAVFLETLTMMAIGSLWAALILFVFGLGKSQWALLAGLLAVVAGIPTFPPVVRRILQILPGSSYSIGQRDGAQSGGRSAGDARVRTQDDLSARVGLEAISIATTAQGWIAASLSWLLLAWSLWAVLVSLGIDQAHAINDLPLLVASVALSVVAGFLSLLPGGLIVRDAILVEILAHWFPASQALLAAILLRLVWIMSELVVSVILYLVGNDPLVDNPSK